MSAMLTFEGLHADALVGQAWDTDNAGFCFLGLGTACNPVNLWVGASIIHDNGTIYNMTPVCIGYQSEAGGTPYIIPVNINQFNDGELVIKLWNGYPSATSTTLQTIRKRANDVYMQKTSNLLYDIGKSEVNIVENVVETAEGATNTLASLGGILPLILIGALIFIAKDKF